MPKKVLRAEYSFYTEDVEALRREWKRDRYYKARPFSRFLASIFAEAVYRKRDDIVEYESWKEEDDDEHTD